MAPRDRLPRFTDEPAEAGATPVQDALRRVGSWMGVMTMAVGLLVLGYMLGGR